LGSHILDIARFLLGDASRITAKTQRVNQVIRGEDISTMQVTGVALRICAVL
jgi:predicted dehydrogenase